ncbi:hypothetical protein HAX54_001466 [Datura stramonium]|uniref:Uncharacterized protein n=1 Tax=Datura stramonium TaxID=4076 RepID=A0ABS8T2E0_DATST|nr:hypothetical protein [Datura stramonium]
MVASEDLPSFLHAVRGTVRMFMLPLVCLLCSRRIRLMPKVWFVCGLCGPYSALHVDSELPPPSILSSKVLRRQICSLLMTSLRTDSELEGESGEPYFRRLVLRSVANIIRLYSSSLITESESFGGQNVVEGGWVEVAQRGDTHIERILLESGRKGSQRRRITSMEKIKDFWVHFESC